MEVARRFYSSIFVQKGWPSINDRQVALALQEAVLAVREADLNMPLL